MEVIESTSSNTSLNQPQADHGANYESTETLFNVLLEKLWSRVESEGNSTELRDAICSVETSRRNFLLGTATPIVEVPKVEAVSKFVDLNTMTPQHRTLM